MPHLSCSQNFLDPGHDKSRGRTFGFIDQEKTASRHGALHDGFALWPSPLRILAESSGFNLLQKPFDLLRLVFGLIVKELDGGYESKVELLGSFRSDKARGA